MNDTRGDTCRTGRAIISTDPLIAPTEDLLDETGPEAEARPFAIEAAQHGERLDRALARLVPEFSRSYLQQLVEAGAVTLQGAAVLKPSLKVKAGDALTVALRPTPQAQAFLPEAMPLEIVFEDAHLCVINKPAGLVVHPAPGNWTGTLLNGLLGTNINIAAASYNALLNARVSAFGFLDALASELNITAGTYADVLRAKADHGVIARALAATLNGTEKTAMQTIAAAAGHNGKVEIGKLFDLGRYANLALGTGETGVFTKVSALEMLSVSAALSAPSVRTQIGERLVPVARRRSRRSVLAFGVVCSWGRTSPSAMARAPMTPRLVRATPNSSVPAISYA